MSDQFRRPGPEDQQVLEGLQVRLLERQELERCHRLLEQHHYLGSLKPVGERLYYVATDPQGQWLARLVFAAAARHLKYRDRWIGWTDAQRERRLPLVVNNIRFLLLPDRTFPNLGTRVLRRVLTRLSRDWQTAYGHPVLVVPSQYFLGGAIVDTKTNEIPVARQLFQKLDLSGRWVSLDALHTQTETARDLVLEAGADSLLTAKDNQPTVRQNIEQLLPAPKADFPPLATDAHRVPHPGLRQEPLDPHPAGLP